MSSPTKTVASLVALDRVDALLPYVQSELVRHPDQQRQQRQQLFVSMLRALGSTVNAKTRAQLEPAIELVRKWLGDLPPAEVLVAGYVALIAGHSSQTHPPPKKRAVALIKHGLRTEAQQWIEMWLGNATESAASYTAYEQIVELYVVHCLGGLGDYVAAREFLLFNESLTPAARQRFLSALEVSERERVRPPQPQPLAAAAAAEAAAAAAIVAPIVSRDTTDNNINNSWDAVNTPTAVNAPTATSSRIKKQPPIATTRPPSSRHQLPMLELVPGALLALTIVLAFWYRRRLAESSLWKALVGTAEMGMNIRY